MPGMPARNSCDVAVFKLSFDFADEALVCPPAIPPGVAAPFAFAVLDAPGEELLVCVPELQAETSEAVMTSAANSRVARRASDGRSFMRFSLSVRNEFFRGIV
jgi:hypothetical protein